MDTFVRPVALQQRGEQPPLVRYAAAAIQQASVKKVHTSTPKLTKLIDLQHIYKAFGEMACGTGRMVKGGGEGKGLCMRVG